MYKTPGLTPGRGQNIYNCDYTQPPPPGQVCDVDIKNWAPCTQENNYNYHRSAPCIFLKLNKIYGWIPEYYNQTDQLPNGMPKDLQDHIKDIEKTQRPAVRIFLWLFLIKHLITCFSFQLNTIWVSCEGENPADIENVGPIKYYPRRGFPGYFYPFENSEGYLSPLVAVHFERPVREYKRCGNLWMIFLNKFMLSGGIIINVECKAWAHNIKHDRHDRIGSVHFELMID